jgi:hypothetical protein
VQAMSRAWPSLEITLPQRMWLLLGDHPDWDSFKSGLNNDGSPLQICISAGPTTTVAHLIADPGSEAPSPAGHHARGLACLHSVMSCQSDGPGRETVARCVAMNLPTHPADELAVGTIWLGLPIQGPGLTVYLNAAWGGQDASWGRTSAWLHAEGVAAAVSDPTIARLRTVARPVSVGLDVLPNAAPRLKVYFRLTRSARLDEFGDPAWTSDAMLAFLKEIIRGQRIRMSGLVFCVEFTSNAAHVAGVKVDVCAHCLDYEAADWPPILARTARALGTRPLQTVAWSTGQDAEIAVIGVGCRIDGAVRCNLYFKGRA